MTATGNMTSWIDDESSEYLYMYDLDTGDYTGKVKMQPAPKWLQGEIECLTFDKESGRFLLLYNRGAKITAGMPVGFYEGYSEEVHEVFVYDTSFR